jgi:chromosome segregation ATPase
MHAEMMQLKAKVAALEQQRQDIRLMLSKKQKALKEVGRVAAQLAKQPNQTHAAPSSSSFATHHPTHKQRRTAVDSPADAGTADRQSTRISQLRSSNAILQLELSDLSEQLSALQGAALSRSEPQLTLSALERERSSLARSVSVSAAARSLSSFQGQQSVADLQFAVAEMQSALADKQREAARLRAQTRQAEQQQIKLNRAYAEGQKQMDALTAQRYAQE